MHPAPSTSVVFLRTLPPYPTLGSGRGRGPFFPVRNGLCVVPQALRNTSAGKDYGPRKQSSAFWSD